MLLVIAYRVDLYGYSLHVLAYRCLIDIDLHACNIIAGSLLGVPCSLVAA